MKPQSRVRYAEKIDRVLRFLEQGEIDNVDLDSLAGVAALSPHHFHRIFRLMTGETAAETVQRLKLARSVPVL
jgi:AraC family transcriptional regulator